MAENPAHESLFPARRPYREGRAENALRWTAARVNWLARRLTYRGGERSPRFLLERLSDRLVFAAIFRAMKRCEW